MWTAPLVFWIGYHSQTAAPLISLGNISTQKGQVLVPEGRGQFRLVRVHHEHREELSRLRLAAAEFPGQRATASMRLT